MDGHCPPTLIIFSPHLPSTNPPPSISTSLPQPRGTKGWMPLLSRPEVGGLPAFTRQAWGQWPASYFPHYEPALLDRPEVSGLLVIFPNTFIAHIIIIIQLCWQSNSARIYQAIPIIQAQCQQSNAISFNSISRVVSGLTYPQGSPPYKRKVLLASRHVQTSAMLWVLCSTWSNLA